jgi:hypothetical protein
MEKDCLGNHLGNYLGNRLWKRKKALGNRFIQPKQVTQHSM